MNCPACNNVELVRRERFGIPITRCPHCRGIWLDRRSIDGLTENTGLFLKARAGSQGRTGLRQPLWQELFDGE